MCIEFQTLNPSSFTLFPSSLPLITMNVFIGLLIFAAFLQTSFVPVNMVLVLIVARSLLIDARSNYFLAFSAGILLGVLSAQNIGYWPIILLIAVKVTYLIRKLPFNIGLPTFLLALALSLTIQILAEYLFLHHSINWTKPLTEFITGIPIFLFIRFWEDRFMIHTQGVKLKMRR